jgi:hypothetical protein
LSVKGSSFRDEIGGATSAVGRWETSAYTLAETDCECHSRGVVPRPTEIKKIFEKQSVDGRAFDGIQPRARLHRVIVER